MKDVTIDTNQRYNKRSSRRGTRSNIILNRNI
ncbi:hypothetical protein DZE41_005391 [Clostridium beijerinckii]|nr:hypothetical protein [Clostridium beijerinckii]